MSHAFQKFWLKITAVIVGSLGPVFFLGAMTPTLAPARLTLDLLGWKLGQPSAYDAPDTRFLSALAGGFLLGWGVMIWCLSVWAYDTAPEGVRRSVLVGSLAWFCVDSAGSIASGNPSNAAFNVLVLLASIGPLLRPASDGIALSSGRGAYTSPPGD
jgi:hypothetical protein